MPSKTNEQALEAAIEKALTGTTIEEMKDLTGFQNLSGLVADKAEQYRAGNGYYLGVPQDFDAQYAIDIKRFWHFLEATQPNEIAKIKATNPQYKLAIVQRFDRMAKKYGILGLLRKGLDIENAHFELFYTAPLASSSASVRAHFEQNEFSVTRQLRYSTKNKLEEIDLVIFVNGIPIITIELKNQWTGQNAKVHGQKQYKSRDTKETLLNFGRCLVHFAVDTDEVYMTTKLNGKDTFFLPFNQGFNDGQGNPPNAFGYKTDYLWNDVFSRKSISNIIQHFVRFDGQPKDALKKRTLFFPRYHQMDVVRKIIADLSEKGVGQKYLVQHSAGSGKSNSITWAAYQLIEAYPDNSSVNGYKGLDVPLIDSVIVVTDRRLLDKQIRDNIKEFSQVKNIVAHAEKSSDLRAHLENGKKIIISTIQKFPFIIEDIEDFSDKNFAVIIDEAHSSQSGSAHDKMNQAMGVGQGHALADADAEDAQDKILQTMKGRKMSKNASYLAFTATPKNSTLEKFGVKQPDGQFKPFHLYSMKQAIEEGFILDVLANYTTYKSYYEIQKSIADNPNYDTKKAQKKLKAYVESHEETINTKAEIMMNHFLDKVVRPKRLKGKGKAIIATQSIATAIEYFKAIRRILEEKGKPFKAIVTFSDTEIKGEKIKDADLNHFPSKDVKEKFDTDEYRILVVANKFLTGFDQPKLCAMYVDKKLSSVLAVQALSRLNRSANKLGKRTEHLFILDFYNSTEEIQQAFEPFYTATSLSQATDVNVLHELKDMLDITGIYEQSEVEQFNILYFNNEKGEKLTVPIDKAAGRFNVTLKLETEEKIDFKVKAKQFVKIYGQMASIMPYENINWEKLYWFLKFLVPKLVIPKEADQDDSLLNAVDLSTYGLERVKLNESIALDDEESELDPQNPNPRGGHTNEEEQDPLDLIIRAFNEKYYGIGDSHDEQTTKVVNIAKRIRTEANYEKQVLNNTDAQNRGLAFEKMVSQAIRLQRKQDLEMYKRYHQDEGYKQGFIDMISRVLDLRV
jgi:type I restriction enzyme R subunit